LENEIKEGTVGLLLYSVGSSCIRLLIDSYTAKKVGVFFIHSVYVIHFETADHPHG